MDLNQLKSFVAVAHQGNLTQAAEALHLSQPAVSAQIKAIEKNLDIVLFERNAQGMALTRSGAALLPQAEALLQHMHQLNQFAASLAENYTGQIDVGRSTPCPAAKWPCSPNTCASNCRRCSSTATTNSVATSLTPCAKKSCTPAFSWPQSLSQRAQHFSRSHGLCADCAASLASRY